MKVEKREILLERFCYVCLGFSNCYISIHIGFLGVQAVGGMILEIKSPVWCFSLTCVSKVYLQTNIKRMSEKKNHKQHGIKASHLWFVPFSASDHNRTFGLNASGGDVLKILQLADPSEIQSLFFYPKISLNSFLIAYFRNKCWN